MEIFKKGTNWRFLILLLLNFIVSSLNAQIDLALLANVSGDFYISDLFKLHVNNNNSKSLNVSLNFELINQGKSIYKCQINSIEFPIGSTFLQRDQIPLENEQFFGDSKSEFLSGTKVIPAGKYNWCIKITDKFTKEEIDKNCFPIDIEPITPPILMSPENGGVIENKQPLLIWLGPSPRTFEYSYEIILTEIIGKQAPMDAVRKNFPLVKMKNLKETQLQYPLSSPELEYGKKYAWQIKATNSNGAIAYTETWYFTPKIDTSFENVVFYENFIIPRAKQDGSSINVKNLLNVDLSNLVDLNDYTYQIIDMKDRIVINNESNLVKSLSGNRFTLELSKSDKLKSKTLYLLKIQGVKGFNGFVLFKLYKNNDGK
jgi:hypothetical protein